MRESKLGRRGARSDKSKLRHAKSMALTTQTESDRLFHALGDPTRRAMLDRLVHGPLSVSALAAPLGITLTAVAQHLQILEECALVRTEKVGRVRTCRIEMAGFDNLEEWIADHRTIWAQRLDRLGALLDDLDEETN
jgi:DNA-binding transcriptional ArsR family regulator